MSRRSVCVAMIAGALACGLAPRANAQLAAPGDAGVVMGHLHLMVKDVDAQQKFWAALGGMPVQNGALALIQFPGTFVMLRKAEPTGGTVGSTINHVGFLVKDIAPWIGKWQAAGLKMEPQARPTQVYLIGPDDVRVEILEDKTIDVPLKMHHVHFYIAAPLETQAWYAKTFGAVPGKRGQFDAADLPGVNLTFAKEEGPTAPTKGRSLDHIGFEVKNLEAFCKKLEASGIKLDRPYTRLPNSATAIAFLTDPWGTYIELTENLAPAPQAAADHNVAAWEKQAQDITITRDDWGIAHVVGKTDADAVFGVMYAQAEDDFNRVETNYLNSMGRLAEAEGEREIYRDLRMKLFIDPADMKAQYQKSPEWLKQLMNAYADGLNYYLYKHPAVKPRVITHFEPWMALTFSEGSIGGDIEKVNLNQLESFYGKTPLKATPAEELDRFVEPTGSNGAAIAPSNTASHHALLLINPHTSFYFRSEAQMTSGEGLNAYGALTWGQFFIYQGFNERAGWMHTSSGVDNIDDYTETVTKKGAGYTYRYGAEDRPVTVSKITVPYKTPSGMANRDFTIYKTHHGPVVREVDGKWVSIRLMQEPLKALQQSYLRIKARNYKAFKETMELHTNSSNNTIYADADGSIAYFHANFIPKRDGKFDWTRPVDGSNPATEWNGVLSVDQSPNLLNPATGWLYNANNWPWSAAGPNSPKKADYPSYVDRGVEESPRGYHALRVLDKKKDFTLDSLIAAAYDSYLPAFGVLMPRLLKAYDAAPASNPLKGKLTDQIAALRRWDYRWSTSSVPTALAVYWGDELGRRVGDQARKTGVTADHYMMNSATAGEQLQALAAASDTLAADFGKWNTPWGDINRFQRLTAEIDHKFSDAGPSIPVGFTSARWGSLASFGARSYKDTKKMYGNTGNSFVAVVEFGDTVSAKAVSAGGESGDPKSKHFKDQAQRYSTGSLRDVYFYPAQLTGHTERQYHPGQ